VEYCPSQGCGHAPVGGEGGEDGEGGESEEGVYLHRDAPHKHAPAGAGLLNPLPPSAIAYS